MLVTLISKLFNRKDKYNVEKIEGDVAIEGNVEFGHDVEVDGDIKVNGVENLTDKDGNSLDFGTQLYKHSISLIRVYDFDTEEEVGNISDFYLVLADNTPITKNNIMNYLMNEQNHSSVIVSGGTLSIIEGTYTFLFQSPGLLLKQDRTIVAFSSLNITANKDDFTDTITEF